MLYYTINELLIQTAVLNDRIPDDAGYCRGDCEDDDQI